LSVVDCLLSELIVVECLLIVCDMSDSGEMGCLALIDHGKWVNGMNEEDVRRILGRRVIGDDEIMAVVFGLGLWGGFKVDDRRCMTIDLRSFVCG
jgi:hypothetical protein